MSFTTAKEIADLLPSGTVWSFHITELQDDAVFNIYAPRETWHALRIMLSIAHRAEFRFDATLPGGESFEEYKYGSLVLSFIHTEETDERAGADSDGPEFYPEPSYLGYADDGDGTD